MIISGVTRSDGIDILQPANLTAEMILEVRVYRFMIMSIINCEHLHGNSSPLHW
jgi:hypothetical protein